MKIKSSFNLTIDERYNLGRWFISEKTIRRDLRAIWKSSRGHSQYPKKIDSKAREFDFSGWDCKGRVAEAKGGGRSQLSRSKSQKDEGKSELINSKNPSTQNHAVQRGIAQSSHAGWRRGWRRSPRGFEICLEGPENSARCLQIFLCSSDSCKCTFHFWR